SLATGSAGTGTYYEMAFGGLLTGSGDVTKTGATDVLLWGRNNTVTGTWSAGSSGGILYLGAVNALGSGAILDAGGSQLGGVRAFTIAATQTLTGPGGSSVSIADAGYNQQVGQLQSTGGFVRLGLKDAQAATLMFGFSNVDTEFQGQLNGDSANSQFAKVGTGKFNYTANVTTSGVSNGTTPLAGISVQDGTFQMQDKGVFTAGATTAVGEVGIYAGATLRLDNFTAANFTDRLSDNATVRLGGGTLQIDGNASANSSETFGRLTLNSGQSAIVLNTAAGSGFSTAFAFSATGTNFISNSTATAFFVGLGLGSGASESTKVTFATAPATVGGGGTFAQNNTSIIPNATADSTGAGTPTSLVGYDSVNGVRPITIYAPAIAGAANDANVRFTANEALIQAGTTLNSLLIVNNALSQGFAPGTPFTLTSGALLQTASGSGTPVNSNLTGPIRFGTGGGSTAYITVAGLAAIDSLTLTSGSALTAANLSKNGGGTLYLQASQFNPTTVTLGNSNVTAPVVAVNAGTLKADPYTSFNLGASATSLTYQISKGATLDVSVLAINTSDSTTRTLTGAGTVTGQVTVGSGGTVRPSALGGTTGGASPGTLSVGSAVFA
ncbi:MAG: hypothetical protein WCL32_24770, partial [Planctomycetota bacterium]